MADTMTQTMQRREGAGADWSAGAAYIDGAVMPLRDAKTPVTDWGYRRSDVTYDVVGVYFGAFFRLEDHLRRFRALDGQAQAKPRESDEEIATILTDLVRPKQSVLEVRPQSIGFSEKQYQVSARLARHCRFS
jgi:branched-subunit amino acid aminotransferase/4-amino-4-deoxychorismate lyase